MPAHWERLSFSFVRCATLDACSLNTFSGRSVDRGEYETMLGSDLDCYLDVTGYY